MYYLIKYGYEGTMFSGFQRGNGSNSVEDSVIRVLEKYGIKESKEKLINDIGVNYYSTLGKFADIIGYSL